jgi:hypothetical protein
MMTTPRTDGQLLEWLRSAEYGRRYCSWWDRFDNKLAARAADPLSEGEVAAAIKDMAAELDLPADVAGGFFKRELNPEGYAEFGRRTLQ